jgi:hypothetical protein
LQQQVRSKVTIVGLDKGFDKDEQKTIIKSMQYVLRGFLWNGLSKH